IMVNSGAGSDYIVVRGTDAAVPVTVNSTGDATVVVEYTKVGQGEVTITNLYGNGKLNVRYLADVSFTKRGVKLARTSIAGGDFGKLELGAAPLYYLCGSLDSLTVDFSQPTVVPL